MDNSEILKRATSFWSRDSGFADARKVLNRAPDVMVDVAREDLEGGVSLERIEELARRVPVFLYKTQVTIHGIFPPEPPRAVGYVSLVVNQNGSLGVKWRAVDGEKKRTIKRYCDKLKTDFYVIEDSRGFSLVRIVEDSEENLQKLRDILSRFREGSFIGTKSLYRSTSLLGRFLVARLYIAAIPAANMPAFVEALTGKPIAQAESELREAERREEEEHRAWSARFDGLERKRKEEAAAIHSRMREEIAAAKNLSLVKQPAFGKRYILPRFSDYPQSCGFAVVAYKKAFGRVVRNTFLFRSLGRAIANKDSLQFAKRALECQLEPVYEVIG